MCLREEIKRAQLLPHTMYHVVSVYISTHVIYIYIYIYIYICVYIHIFLCVYVFEGGNQTCSTASPHNVLCRLSVYINTRTLGVDMGWLRLVGSLKS